MAMTAGTRKFAFSGAIILAGAAAVLVFLQRELIVRLTREKMGLEQAKQSEERAAEDQRFSTRVAQSRAAQLQSEEQEHELLRLRGEVARLRQEAKELSRLQEENHQFRTALAARQNSKGITAAPDFVPKESWAFVGYATPEASLQSGLWAATTGDMKSFFSSITGEMEAMVQKDLAGKSDADARAKLAEEVAGLKSYRIIDRQVLSDDEVVLTVSIEEAGEKAATETQKFTMRKVANDWRFSASTNGPSNISQ